MAYQDKWMVKSVRVQPGTKAGKKILDETLLDGWEPFAVTWDGHVFDYHLKKFDYYGSSEEH